METAEEAPLVYAMGAENHLLRLLRGVADRHGYQLKSVRTDDALPVGQRLSCLVLSADPEDQGLGEHLLRRRIENPFLPILVVLPNADVAAAVQVMKRGAHDLLVQPLTEDSITVGLREALYWATERRRIHRDDVEVGRRLAGLTPRERQVLELIAVGAQNKTIAQELGISQKTVEAHRANVMTKMQATTAAGLMSLVAAYRARNESRLTLAAARGF